MSGAFQDSDTPIHRQLPVKRWEYGAIVALALQLFSSQLVLKVPLGTTMSDKVASPGSSLGVVHAVYVQLGGHTGEASGNHVGVGQP